MWAAFVHVGLDLRLSLKEAWRYSMRKRQYCKRSECGQCHRPLHCVFQTPSGILSANRYANPHASRTSQTPTLNLQLHPFSDCSIPSCHPDLAGNFHPCFIIPPLAKLEHGPLHADPWDPYAASIYSDINRAQTWGKKRALGGDCFKEAKNQGYWKVFCFVFFLFFCSWRSETFG